MEWSSKWRDGRQYRASPRALVISGVVSLAVALGVLVAAMVTWNTTNNFVQNAVSVPGTVTGLAQERDDHNESTLYAPVFAFTTQDGRTQSVTSGVYSHPADYHVGDRVTVLYNPAEPSSARIDSFWQTWFLPAFLAVMGACLGLMATIFLFVGRRRMARQAAPAVPAP
jgi:Protein of unknown function (DUF3592)